MTKLWAVPWFEQLPDAKSVLIAGAGGGFDVFARLPLYRSLRSQRRQACLANLSFSHLGGADATRLDEVTYEVRSLEGSESIFDERARIEAFCSTIRRRPRAEIPR